MCLDVLSARLKRRRDWRCLFLVGALAHAVRTSAAGNRYLCIGFLLRVSLEDFSGEFSSADTESWIPLLCPGDTRSWHSRLAELLYLMETL
jgi:hypothetical protein